MQADSPSRTFAALADPTRRAILARLAAGEASVTEPGLRLPDPGPSKPDTQRWIGLQTN